jgi:hypothetical protein
MLQNRSTVRCCKCKITKEPGRTEKGNVNRLDTDAYMVCPKPKGSRKRVRGLKVCPHCRTLWSRDFNAAVNILLDFLHFVKHGVHAPHLESAAAKKKKRANNK